MSSSEKPNTWTDDPEQEVSKKRKSHAALSARSPEKNWDSEWYKKQKTCVGYIIAYITNLHKRPGLFPKKKDTLTLDQMSSALSHQHEKNHGIIAAERSQRKSLKTPDDWWFPHRAFHSSQPIGDIAPKRKLFFFEKAANLCTKIIFFTPTHLVDSNRQAHKKKKISKTSKSQRGFFSHAARVRKEKRLVYRVKR